MRKNAKTKILEKSEYITEKLSFPQDTINGASIVTITGTLRMLIENYKGLLEYSEEKIVLQAKHCKITIEGKHLFVKYYNAQDMLIEGKIEKIEYHI